MKLLAAVILAGFVGFAPRARAQETLIYHTIEVDSQGYILPWYDPDLATSYDHVIHLVWNFWDKMRVDANGLPYYMNHQVWTAEGDDPRGVGGDQLQMALSSWQLLYAYTGNERIKQNMKFMADYYLSHSLSPDNCRWPNLPYPYNTLIYSGFYDGDMVIGQDYLQPDKAGSLGLELVHLYKLVKGDSSIQSIPGHYLSAAIKIGQTLEKNVRRGDAKNSPLPFKVNAISGKVGQLLSNNGDGSVVGIASYTTNWAPTMELFLALEDLDPANKLRYQKAFNTLLQWMKKYPLKTNNWGPFFEDVQGWSDTQINAVTFARFMMEHREYFSEWQGEVKKIFAWVYATLGNDNWHSYGVTVVNEQTSFPVPGQSHMARQGAAELLYCKLSGDCAQKDEALRRLSWATYSVDVDGKNRFPFDGNWLTDGYGDYVRHYLRAMATFPDLAPSFANHVLSSTSVVQQVTYNPVDNKDFFIPFNITALIYRTYDAQGIEIVRMTRKPAVVLVDSLPLKEVTEENSPGYFWAPLNVGGYLQINRENGREVTILE